ncbi:MAG TPA: hypothetical protein VFP98_05415, partial [Candidatus Polarisedimenticolia bacterium]|nr:hypothetical protein [Candidatus Polarisedimenticolia bacterium]
MSIFRTIALILLIALSATISSRAGQAGPDDPNGPAETGAPAPRRPLGFRVFGNLDKPLAGIWDLEIPESGSVRIELREVDAGSTGALVGVGGPLGEEILRVARKKEGVGYEGQLLRVFAACGFDALQISEFLPLGDAVALRFEARPPETPCPSIDSGRTGRYHILSPRGGPVRLRDLSEISSPKVRDTYGIGGERSGSQVTYELPLGAVSVEDGAEVRFVQRLKAPLDGSVWFEVEAIVAPEEGVRPPRGYLKSES